MQTSIVSIVSDGASVMKKLGKISQLETKLCYAHSVHLAVCDVLYKNRSVTHIAGEDYDDDQDEEMYEESFGSVTPTIALNEVPVFNLEIENVLKKVRKVVKIFRKGPVKNEVLQKYVLLEQNKELSLVLDRKTRWSSMYEMVEGLICLKKCISKALLDLLIEHGICTTEFSFLNELKCALEPIKLVVEALCGKDATLLTAKKVFQFLFVELEKRKSSLAEDLFCAVKNRVQQRRQHEVVNLLRYFQNLNSSIYNEHYADEIPSCSNSEEGFMKTATTLFWRLFWRSDSNKAKSQDENEVIELASNNQKDESFCKRLQTHIEHSTNSTPTQPLKTIVDDRRQISQLQTVIKQEMKLLEATEKRPGKLEQLFKALLSILPTSVEAERAFSAAGLFTTKLRSRLGDKSVNALCFLHSHYMKNK